MSNDFKVPFFKSKRNSLAIDLTLTAKHAANCANKARTISGFIANYDVVLDCFRKLSKMNGKVSSVKGNLVAEYFRLQSETQKHLHDAIDRSGDEIISNHRNLYKYDAPHTQQEILRFRSDIDEYSNRFDEQNSEFARAKYNFVCHSCNMQFLIEHKPTAHGECNSYTIDRMDGHEFEYWCADLLRNNGFTNVEVTQGSGDQGVDILSEKDGIRYAIQCKCYSSDLGNKPVQEVNAGKLIYHCHIGAVMTNRFFTDGAKQAAEATGVLLWDRNKLMEFMENANKG